MGRIILAIMLTCFRTIASSVLTCNYQCQGPYTCDAGEPCSVTCSGMAACDDKLIDAREATSLRFESTGAYHASRVTLYCPNSGSGTCNAICNATDACIGITMYANSVDLTYITYGWNREINIYCEDASSCNLKGINDVVALDDVMIHGSFDQINIECIGVSECFESFTLDCSSDYCWVDPNTLNSCSPSSVCDNSTPTIASTTTLAPTDTPSDVLTVTTSNGYTTNIPTKLTTGHTETMTPSKDPSTSINTSGTPLWSTIPFKEHNQNDNHTFSIVGGLLVSILLCFICFMYYTLHRKEDKRSGDIHSSQLTRVVSMSNAETTKADHTDINVNTNTLSDHVTEGEKETNIDTDIADDEFIITGDDEMEMVANDNVTDGNREYHKQRSGEMDPPSGVVTAAVIYQPTQKRQELEEWFRNVVQLPYYDVFIENGFEELSTVSMITMDVLDSMGIHKIGHRLKLMQHIQNICTVNNE